MVDSKENYKFDPGVKGLINTFGWDLVNKVWLFRYGCVFERYNDILLSERGLHSQSSLRFAFFFFFGLAQRTSPKRRDSSQLTFVNVNTFRSKTFHSSPAQLQGVTLLLVPTAEQCQ